MIIAWTFFIVLCAIDVMAVLAIVAHLRDGESMEAARVTWTLVAFLLLTAIPAQYIFGG